MSVPAAGTRSNGKCGSAKISKPLFEYCTGAPSSKRFGPRAAPTFNTLIASRWEEAQAYTQRGLAVVPLPPGKKRPAIRWKAYQSDAPTPDEVDGWWRDRPDDGMAVVLGPVSNVLAIDVDGPDAHAELVRRLGAEPVAPKFLTGSGKPCRYQLLFRHPAGLPTRAKITPWHPQLEFRGRGGLSVMPPSVHPSGGNIGGRMGGLFRRWRYRNCRHSFLMRYERTPKHEATVPELSPERWPWGRIF